MFIAIDSNKNVQLIQENRAIQDLLKGSDTKYYEINLDGKFPVFNLVTIKNTTLISKSISRTVVEANGVEVMFNDVDQ